MLDKIYKHDAISLLKNKEVKKKIRDNAAFLKQYNFSLSMKEDTDFFYFECLLLTLRNKEVFENSFIATFDDMIHYWQTLNYAERKHLVNVDIHQAIQDLKYVDHQGERFYLPCMNNKMNRIYLNEMVLFELKQYNRLRFDCKDMIDKMVIHYEMVRDGFTSLLLVKGNEENFWAYCSINKQLYHFVNLEVVEKVVLVNCDDQLDTLIDFMDVYENHDEVQTVAYMLEHHLISEKMEKKMKKRLKR